MRLIASLFLKNSSDAFIGISVLAKFLRTHALLFIVPSMTPLGENYYNPCSLDDSIHTYLCPQSIAHLLFAQRLRYFTGHSASAQ